jgi:hypothetical protein
MIHTLVKDIYQQVEKKDGWFSEEMAGTLSSSITNRLREQLGRPKQNPSLRLSQMGARCPKSLWFSIHHPELAELLPAWAEIKYSFGHVLEALAISLARAAGHEVTGEQHEVSVDGIVGHLDCIIDGCVVDVKSSSSMGFNKFKDGSIRENDSFGYLDQLDGYLVGSLENPLVKVKDKGYLLAIDKQLGHMVLYEHTLREQSIRQRIGEYKSIVAATEPPQCTCRSIPDGKSGNLKLDVRASYSSYKYACHPGLRTFLYADGPRYLTHVERKPDVTEVDKHGNIRYN